MLVVRNVGTTLSYCFTLMILQLVRPRPHSTLQFEYWILRSLQLIALSQRRLAPSLILCKLILLLVYLVLLLYLRFGFRTLPFLGSTLLAIFVPYETLLHNIQRLLACALETALPGRLHQVFAALWWRGETAAVHVMNRVHLWHASVETVLGRFGRLDRHRLI